MNNAGASIIFAIFTLVVLSILGVMIFSIISPDIELSTNQILSTRAFLTTESGWQIGAQAVKNDKDAYQTTSPSQNGYYGISYLEGGYNDAAGGLGYEYWPNSGPASTRVLSPTNLCFHGSGLTDSSPNACSLQTVVNSRVILRDFYQSRNLIGARLRQVRLVLRARKSSNGGVDVTVQVRYTLNGSTTPIENYTVLSPNITLTNTTWGYYYWDITPMPTWQNIMQDNEFRIAVVRIDALGPPYRNAEIDWLALEVTTEVDSPTETWFTDWMNPDGSVKQVNLPLEGGLIESIKISDESGKIHLNYASWDLMRRLFYYCGITPQGTANTLATNIITYRGATLSNPFNTIEEVKQVSGMTDARFDLIDQDITVYSWVNQNVMRPAGSRAPVNINTASINVLKAIFRTATANESDVADLADDVYTQARTNPFTHMFSYYGNQNDSQCFSNFIETRDYLSGGQRNAIRNVADGSYYNRVLNGNWTSGAGNSLGTEFCYFSHTFLIESKSKSGNIERTVYETYGDTYNYTTYSYNSPSTLALPTYIGEANPKPYWREER